MNELQIIEQKGNRVLTSSQLAEAYGTTTKIISQNYSRNKSRYTFSKHFIELNGEDLQEFKKAYPQIEDTLKFSSVLYLWTDKGAWLHAKSLNTDQAWDAYESLVDDYYEKTNQLQQPKSQAELIAMLAQFNVDQEKRIKAVEQRVEETSKRQEDITEVLSLNPTEWRKKTTSLLNKIAKKFGGVDAYRDIRNQSYEKLEERAKCDLNIRLKNRRSNMALEGVSKSKINKVNKMDVIASDARLTEIYLAIIKEMAIRHNIDANDIQEGE